MNLKKTFNIFFVSLMILIILAGISTFFLMKLYNINLDQAEQTFRIGLDFKFVTMDDVDEYYSNNIGRVDVINYDLDIDVNLKDESITGLAKIKFIPIFDLDNFISFDFSSDFDEISVFHNGDNLEFKKISDQINIKLPPNSSDTLEIIIKYSGTPENKGLGSFLFTEDDEKDEKRILTLNEPIYASTWFPCNDYPDDKAFLTIAITNDSAYTSVSNGSLIQTKTIEEKKRYTWQTSYPISTYLVGFYSAKYVEISDSLILENDRIIPIKYYIINDDFRKSVYDLEVSKEALKYFDSAFGNYPFEKEKYAIAEFDWQMGAIENQTIVGIGSKLTSGNRFFSDVIVHEAAHHWWGNAVGLKSWEDIWLNEGFSSYSEAMYWENKSGRSSLISTLFSKRMDFNDTKLFDPQGFLFSSTIYNKGAWVLHMLRFEIGENDFSELMKKFFEKYKYSNASTNDFKNIAESISNKNLTKFFDQWVFIGKGFIYADYFLSKIDDKPVLRIQQMQDGYEEYHFMLEVNLIGELENTIQKFYINSADTTIQLNSEFEIKDIIIDPNNWLLANFIKEDSK